VVLTAEGKSNAGIRLVRLAVVPPFVLNCRELANVLIDPDLRSFF